MSTRARTAHRCTECGWTTAKWVGRCGECQAWGTLVEAPGAAASGARGVLSAAGGRGGEPLAAATRPAHPARRASEVTGSGPVQRMSTGLAEFDRVVGGGLVAGQVLLLAGEPGAGKSTLLLAVADALARQQLGRGRPGDPHDPGQDPAHRWHGRTVLYVSAEESVEQIAVRAQRTGARADALLLADDTDLGAVLGHVEEHADGLALLVVDSVQTVSSAEVDGRAGGVAQVMAVAGALVRLAKARGLPVCLVGQVTKESTVAGPRSLEHVVDTVLALEGDRHTSLRLLRAVKNRYGPADEVACFEQTDAGLREVPDPSALFRDERDAPVAGTCLTVTVEGRRPLLVEVQALVAATQNPSPRRAVSGLDSARTAMLCAVTERAVGASLARSELYAATVGGVRLSDPGADLAVCLAIASAASGRPLPADVAAVGEVALSGDVRVVQQMAARVAEAVRLGRSRLLVPVGTAARLDARAGAGARLVEVSSLAHAAALLG